MAAKHSTHTGSRQSANHPSRRFCRVKGVARRAGAAGPIYIRMKSTARTALTGGLRTVGLKSPCLKSGRSIVRLLRFYSAILADGTPRSPPCPNSRQCHHRNQNNCAFNGARPLIRMEPSTVSNSKHQRDERHER